MLIEKVATVSATLPRSSQSVPHRRRSFYQVSTPIWLGQICRIGRWEHAASARSPSRSHFRTHSLTLLLATTSPAPGTTPPVVHTARRVAAYTHTAPPEPWPAALAQRLLASAQDKLRSGTVRHGNLNPAAVGTRPAQYDLPSGPPCLLLGRRTHTGACVPFPAGHLACALPILGRSPPTPQPVADFWRFLVHHGK